MRLSRMIIGAVLSTTVSALLPSVVAHAVGANLIANPSVEVASTAGQPANWTFNRWGTNTATSAWKSGGLDGQRNLAITMSAYTSGDAKWMSAPATVKPATKYVVSDWYLSNVQTSLEAVYTDAAGKQTYAWLADAPATTAWKQVSVTFTSPANAAKITVFHVLERTGSLQTDLYFLAESGGTAGSTPIPPTVNLTAPAAGATVSGTRQVTATASSEAVGVQFQVDGVNLGVEDAAAPFVATWDTRKTANGARKVTAVARTAAGQIATTNATVTVNNSGGSSPPQTGNVIANPSVETASGAGPANWVGDKWGTNTTKFSYPSTGHTGGRSVKTEITAYTNGDANWAPQPVAVTPGKSYQYSNWYQSNVDTEVDVEVNMTDGTAQYDYLANAPASAGWAKVTARYTVPAGAAKITVFQVLSSKGWLVGDDFALNEYTPAQFGRALVSLTFDDGWRSQFTAGVPLFDKYHMPVTFYLLTGTITYPDYMSQAQLGQLPGHGHEIASHTVDHPHLPTLTAGQVDAELKNSQAALRQWYGPTVAKNFATPYGEYNSTVLAASKKYYRSHRSTDEGFNTRDDTDTNDIKVQNVLDTTAPAQVGAWVDQAIRDKSWLVLVYHEVDAGAEDPTYAVTPANLDAELKLIQGKGIAVKTVDQALDELTPQL